MNITAVTAQAEQKRTSYSNNSQAVNVFRQQSFLQRAAKDKESSLLNEIANRMTDRFERAEALESQIKTFDIRMEQLTETNSNLEELDAEVLEMHLEMCKFMGRAAKWQEKELTEFRDQLASFDELIQSYQDIVDRKSGLTDMTMDQAKELLAAAQMQREAYVQKGIEFLNRIHLGAEDMTASYSGINSALEAAYGKNPFAGQELSGLKTDISADNIYAEIDKALKNVQNVGKVFDEGARRIADALEKKGYGEYKYKLHQSLNEVSERKSYMSDLLEEITREEEKKQVFSAGCTKYVDSDTHE